MRRTTIFCILFLSFTAVIGCDSGARRADLILRNARVYTMEPERPWASGVVISGNRIIAILDDSSDPGDFEGPETEVHDLGGRFVMPGFIDGHMHINSAGALVNDANLLNVSDDEGLVAEMERLIEILDEGEWITGGSWGAYETWERGSMKPKESTSARWMPNRKSIDALTARHPVFVHRYDRAYYLANALALREAGLLETPAEGMLLDAAGAPTGLIERGSPAVGLLRNAVKPKSEKRLMDEIRGVLKVLRTNGIVEVHDITSDEQMERYVKLQQNGELTARLWMRGDLSRASEFRKLGRVFRGHPKTGKPDAFLRWGAFKGYVDGIMGNHTALFYEPYADMPGEYGTYRRQTSDDPEPPYRNPNLEKMFGYLKEASETGFPANVHAIGTKGCAIMLDLYERLMKQRGEKLDGYRVIHAQVIKQEDFPRFQALGVYAEVNPYHLSDDMRWMEERIGHERCRGAYAFRSLIDNGAELVFGSDWGGSPAADYPCHPKYLLHAAVTRTTIKGLPDGGWFPEQKISMEDALRAYTINAARSVFDGESRGSLKAGKLADVVVLNQNLLDIPPDEILNTEVEMTIVDGRIVFEKEKD